MASRERHLENRRSWQQRRPEDLVILKICDIVERRTLEHDVLHGRRIQAPARQWMQLAIVGRRPMRCGRSLHGGGPIALALKRGAWKGDLSAVVGSGNATAVHGCAASIMLSERREHLAPITLAPSQRRQPDVALSAHEPTRHADECRAGADLQKNRVTLRMKRSDRLFESDRLAGMPSPIGGAS